MRLSHIAMLCLSTAFIAAPALAQSSSQSNSSSNPTHSQSSNNSGMEPRQMLKQDLQKAGFTDVRVEPEIFIVHADNSQGQPVLMRIGPDSMEAVTAMKTNQSSSSDSGSSHTHMASGNQSDNNGTTKE